LTKGGFGKELALKGNRGRNRRHLAEKRPGECEGTGERPVTNSKVPRKDPAQKPGCERGTERKIFPGTGTGKDKGKKC